MNSKPGSSRTMTNDNETFICLNRIAMVISSLAELARLPWTKATKRHFNQDWLAATDLILTDRDKYLSIKNSCISEIQRRRNEDSHEPNIVAELESIVQAKDGELRLLTQFETRLEELKKEAEGRVMVEEKEAAAAGSSKEMQEHGSRVCTGVIGPAWPAPSPGNHSVNHPIDANDHLFRNLEGLRNRSLALRNEIAFHKEGDESSRVGILLNKFASQAPFMDLDSEAANIRDVGEKSEAEEYRNATYCAPILTPGPSPIAGRHSSDSDSWNHCAASITWVNMSQQNVDQLVEKVAGLEFDFYHSNGTPSDMLLRIASQLWNWCHMEQEDVGKMIEDGCYSSEEGSESERTAYANEALNKLWQANRDLVELIGRLDVLLDPAERENNDYDVERRSSHTSNSNTGDSTPPWLGEDGFEELTEQWFANYAQRLSMEHSRAQPPEIARLLYPQDTLDNGDPCPSSSGDFDSESLLSDVTPEGEDVIPFDEYLKTIANIAYDAMRSYHDGLSPLEVIDSEILDAAWIIFYYNAQAEKSLRKDGACVGDLVEDATPAQKLAHQLRVYHNTAYQTGSEVDEWLVRNLAALLEEAELRGARSQQVQADSPAPTPLPEVPTMERRWIKCNCGQNQRAVSCPEYPLMTDEEDVEVYDPEVIQQHDRDETARIAWETFHEVRLFPAEKRLLNALKECFGEWNSSRPVDRQVVSTALKILDLAKGKAVMHEEEARVEFGAETNVPNDADEILEEVVEALKEYHELVWHLTEFGVEVSKKVFRATKKVLKLAHMGQREDV